MINRLKLMNLNIPELISQARHFPNSGELCLSPDGLLYLDIDDRYIHELYPLLKNYSPIINKPNYFGQKTAGAHISVIYPEENTAVATQELGVRHTFEIQEVFAVQLDNKCYYGLTVNVPSLIYLRQKYDLEPQLLFKNHWIELHITIGTSAVNL